MQVCTSRRLRQQPPAYAGLKLSCLRESHLHKGFVRDVWPNPLDAAVRAWGSSYGPAKGPGTTQTSGQVPPLHFLSTGPTAVGRTPPCNPLSVMQHLYLWKQVPTLFFLHRELSTAWPTSRMQPPRRVRQHLKPCKLTCSASAVPGTGHRLLRGLLPGLHTHGVRQR